MIKQVKGYEGMYEIELLDNGFSIVRSTQRRVEGRNGRSRFLHSRDLAEVVKYSGKKVPYIYVNLCKDGKNKSISKARLIAENFIENPNGFIHIRFEDKDTMNLNVNNIKWVAHEHRYDYVTGANHINDRRCITERTSKIKRLIITDDVKRYEMEDSLRYTVVICYNGKRYTIGTFGDLDDAQNTRDMFEEAIRHGFSYDVSDFYDNTFFPKDLVHFFTNRNNKKI